MIYLNENYNYTIRNLYNRSNIWEVLFFDINHHLPCIVNLGISEKTTKQKKHIQTRTINDTMINDLREALSAIDISSLLNANLLTDPYIDYEQLKKIITEVYDEYFPEKCVRFN